MKTHALFFSPTRTGATIAKEIQDKLDMEPGDRFDITKAAVEKTFGPDDVVIIAMPIYGSRLPILAAERFKKVQGNGAKAVAITMHGNANVGDALLELTDLCTEQGFEIVAAATFIGEHSFTMKKFPIATGRPDAADLQKAADFVGLIQERLRAGGPFIRPNVPGNHPFSREAMNRPGVAATGTNQENCTQCGMCEAVCPTGAITLTPNGPITDDSKCIWCAACVKACANRARVFILPKIREIAKRLYNNFQERQEPQWYLAEKEESE